MTGISDDEIWSRILGAGSEDEGKRDVGAGLEELAKVMGRFRKALVAEEFTGDEAFQLVREWHITLLDTVHADDDVEDE